MPNILERIALGLGRVKGTYLLGLKGPAGLGDQTAWHTGQYWGEGLAALGGRKPLSKAEMVEQFTSWVYICAKTNADAIASVPLGLYVVSDAKGKRYQTIRTRTIKPPVEKYLSSHAGIRSRIVKGEEVAEVTEHPFLDLMQNVNPVMNGSDLREITSMFLDLTGEAYWYVVRNRLGVPVELWPIPSPYMTPIPGKSLEEFVVGYEYQRGGVKQQLPVEDVIPFQFPNPMNPFKGFSCVRGVADAIYINSKINEYIESMFENKARPGGIFTADVAVSPASLDRAKTELAEKYGGARMAGKSMMLPPGIRFDRDYVTPDELAYIEGKKNIREEICVALGVPISVLVSTDVNRANAETGDYRHAKSGVLPRLRKIEEKINERLLPMFDERLFCAFDNPVPEDRDFLLRKRTADLGSGVSTINEERIAEGKEPVDGGDEPLVPFSVAPLSEVVGGMDEPAPSPMPDGLDDSPDDGDQDDDPDDAGKPKARRAARVRALQREVEAKIREKLGGRE